MLQNMASGHVKATGHVFYMATPSHATESVDELLQYSAAKLSQVQSVMVDTLYTVSLRILPAKAFAHAPCSEILMEN